jgi:hypothetical protein
MTWGKMWKRTRINHPQILNPKYARITVKYCHRIVRPPHRASTRSMRDSIKRIPNHLQDFLISIVVSSRIIFFYKNIFQGRGIGYFSKTPVYRNCNFLIGLSRETVGADQREICRRGRVNCNVSAGSWSYETSYEGSKLLIRTSMCELI